MNPHQQDPPCPGKGPDLSDIDNIWEGLALMNGQAAEKPAQHLLDLTLVFPGGFPHAHTHCCRKENLQWRGKDVWFGAQCTWEIA